MKAIEDLITQIDTFALKNPAAICYDHLGNQQTYGELYEQSQQFAAYLLEKDLPKGPILLIGEQEFLMIVAFLGAVKAGHAYIPVESTTPKSRMGYIYEKAQPVLVVSLEELTSEKFKVDLTAEKLAEIVTGTRQVQLPPRDLTADIYLIFTSGTTGLPKGVPINHEQLLSFVNWQLRSFPLPKNPRYLAQAPFSFDLSVMSLYPALCSGGTLVPLEKEITNEFKALFSWLPKLDLEVWVSTPSFMEICLLAADFCEKNLPDLKVFLFCGEELPKKVAEKLHQAFPHSRIFNTYGPTETTVAVTQVEITPEILEKYPRLPIGYVKEDMEILLVDENLQPVENEGEILISGPSVSKGYYQDPEKTDRAFVTLAGKKYYRTKDQGYFLENLLMYQGRLDFQVKLHGFRLELEDVDQNLRQVSWVENACTVPLYKENRVQNLVAYVVAKPHDFKTPLALTKAIKEELVEKVMPYMVPQRFVFVSELPLTSNGKIDRKGLLAKVNGGQK